LAYKANIKITKYKNQESSDVCYYRILNGHVLYRVFSCSVLLCLRLVSFYCFYVFIFCMLLCAAYCAYSINNN